MRVRARSDRACSLALLAGWLSLLLTVHAAGAAPAQRAARFSLESPDLTAGGWVPLSHVYDRGCHGGNQSPALAWQHAPAGARSFAVLVYDSDARGGWWHWLVIDLPAAVHTLPAGAGTPGGGGAALRGGADAQRFRRLGVWRTLPAPRARPTITTSICMR